jgi:hypothetical protein
MLIIIIIFIIFILIIIIIIIYCNLVSTQWQKLFYMYTKFTCIQTDKTFVCLYHIKYMPGYV